MSSFQPEHSYRQLPPICYADCQPTPVKAPQFIAFNHTLAAELALPEHYWNTTAGLNLFSGNQLPAWTQPLAQAYAGHQFANYVPRLGDGRAILLAEVRDSKGKRLDLQLKGAGQTPYSRRGDGRSPIGPVIREYLISEAMHALGVPTTRALAAVSTGEVVFRDEGLAGAILTRVASSHIRIGTMQFAASQSDSSVVKALADYVIDRHYPTLTHTENRYLGLLQAVIAGQAALVAQWMSLGFIHGVMNTDNMLLSAETIDYGPCAFMEAYNAKQVFSYIDQQGRYAYKNQPAVAQWNLARLAESLLSLLAPDEAIAIELAMTELNQFADIYQQQWLNRFALKLGIEQPIAEDRQLIEDFLSLLQDAAADFTLSFRDLLDAETPYLQQTIAQEPLKPWLKRWQQRLTTQQADANAIMATANPVLIPRNHLIQQVIDDISNTGDLTLFNTLHQLWKDPFSATPENAAYQQPASAEKCVKQTFCGT